MEDFSDDFRPRQPFRQTISVPFLWEEKPGRPKKDWKMMDTFPPISSPLFPSFPSPAKLVASIPFEWEEMPGKPLIQFTPASLATSTHLHVPRLNNPFITNQEEGEMFKSYVEAFEQNSSKESCNNYGSLESDTESGGRSSLSSSSEEGTGNTDVSVVEFHFPFSSPDAGFVRKACFLENDTNVGHPQLLAKNSQRSICNMMVRKTATLEELLLMSRKLNCGRKIPFHEVKKSSIPLDLMSKKGFTCF